MHLQERHDTIKLLRDRIERIMQNIQINGNFFACEKETE